MDYLTFSFAGNSNHKLPNNDDKYSFVIEGICIKVVTDATVADRRITIQDYTSSIVGGTPDLTFMFIAGATQTASQTQYHNFSKRATTDAVYSGNQTRLPLDMIFPSHTWLFALSGGQAGDSIEVVVFYSLRKKGKL